MVAGTLILALVLEPVSGGIFTVKLQEGAIAAWERYVERAEQDDRMIRRTPLDVTAGKAVLVDLNPDGGDAGKDVPGGYIHHWIGAIDIQNATVASVAGVLEDYDRYAQIYQPEVKIASALKIPGDGPRYDLRLVSEQVGSKLIGLNFAFDMRSHVWFRAVNGDTIIESKSYSIRESGSAKPPYTDLLPEGIDHGVVWRMNSYWRLRQTGTDVYAEHQVISLSRKPLFGLHDEIKSRARDSLGSTLEKTRNWLARSR